MILNVPYFPDTYEKAKLASIVTEAQNLIPNNDSWEITSDDLDGIESLKAYAFAYLSGKCTSITLPSSLKRILSYAFAEASNITTLIIPDSVASLAANSFSLSYIENLTIGTGLTSIPANLFGSSGDNYNTLSTLILRNNTNTVKTLVHTNAIPSSIQHIYIQAVGSANVNTLVNNYKKATNWSSLASKISAYPG